MTARPSLIAFFFRMCVVSEGPFGIHREAIPFCRIPL